MKEKYAHLNSVEKALKILSVLADHEQGMGTGELSEKVKFTKPTVSRLLGILTEHGFVQKQPGGKKYALGRAALDIGRSAYKHSWSQLALIAKPIIDELRDTAEESAILEIMMGNSVLLAYRANGPHAVGILVTEGMMVPAHVSPGAKAILAYSSPDVVDRFLKNDLPRYTEKTITDPKTLMRNLQEIKRKGVAFAIGEYNIDIAAMGAPVFNRNLEPIAAVVITMPTYRASSRVQKALASLLKKAAHNISQRVAAYGI